MDSLSPDFVYEDIPEEVRAKVRKYVEKIENENKRLNEENNKRLETELLRLKTELETADIRNILRNLPYPSCACYPNCYNKNI